MEWRFVRKSREVKSWLRTIGVIFSFSLSMSPCSKNSEETSSATLFSISHGFVIAARSHTVINIALKSSLWSSTAQHGLSRTTLKNAPLFLNFTQKRSNQISNIATGTTYLKYTAKSVDKIASSNTLMTLEYSSDEILPSNWFPGEFRIIMH